VIRALAVTRARARARTRQRTRTRARAMARARARREKQLARDKGQERERERERESCSLNKHLLHDFLMYVQFQPELSWAGGGHWAKGTRGSRKYVLQRSSCYMISKCKGIYLHMYIYIMSTLKFWG